MQARPSLGVRQAPQVRRRLAGDIQSAAAARMLNTQFRGMQAITGIAGQGAGIRRRYAAGAVQRITYQGMPHRRQMYPNLVGAPRGDKHVTQEGGGTPFQYSQPG